MVGDEPSRRDVLLSAGGLTALSTLGIGGVGVANGQTSSATVETVDRRQVAADAADGDRLLVRRGSAPGTDERFHLLRFPTSAAGTDVDGDGDVVDVITYYNNRDSAAVIDNPDRFDFDGDGVSGTVFDAVALYNDLS